MLMLLGLDFLVFLASSEFRASKQSNLQIMGESVCLLFSVSWLHSIKRSILELSVHLPAKCSPGKPRVSSLYFVGNLRTKCICSAQWFSTLDLFANIFFGFSEESTVLLNMPSSLLDFCSVIFSFICSYFLFLLFDLVIGEMQRRKAVQQPGSAGRAHRLPQEQPYRLPARRASFRGPGQARDGPRVEEAGYSLRRVQEVNSWSILYYKIICK
jgi:hypothetical protein